MPRQLAPSSRGALWPRLYTKLPFFPNALYVVRRWCVAGPGLSYDRSLVTCQRGKPYKCSQKSSVALCNSNLAALKVVAPCRLVSPPPLRQLNGGGARDRSRRGGSTTVRRLIEQTHILRQFYICVFLVGVKLYYFISWRWLDNFGQRKKKYMPIFLQI